MKRYLNNCFLKKSNSTLKPIFTDFMFLKLHYYFNYTITDLWIKYEIAWILVFFVEWD